MKSDTGIIRNFIDKAKRNYVEINDEIKTSINQHLVSDVPVGLFIVEE